MLQIRTVVSSSQDEWPFAPTYGSLKVSLPIKSTSQIVESR
ncbi:MULTISPECIES: hypothetical protein [unclassified Okeania]|nr:MULTISPECIES: hypothetical protein [unclassified Okeania]